jgi:hypothetical protein
MVVLTYWKHLVSDFVFFPHNFKKYIWFLGESQLLKVTLFGPSLGSVNKHLRDFDNLDLGFIVFDFGNHFSLGCANVESVAAKVRTRCQNVVAGVIRVSLNLKRHV